MFNIPLNLLIKQAIKNMVYQYFLFNLNFKKPIGDSHLEVLNSISTLPEPLIKSIDHLVITNELIIPLMQSSE